MRESGKHGRDRAASRSPRPAYRWALALAGALLAIPLVPAGAGAAAGTGPHETASSEFTTTQPGAPSGSIYDVTYRNPDHPNQNPPAVRRVVIKSPPGTRIDTSVPARCNASDMQLELGGDSACPPGSRIGSGTVTLSVLGGPPSTSQISVFNAANSVIQLVKFGSFGVGVARSRISGNTVDTRVPTCVTGGQPPSGCPFDEAVVLASRVVFATIRRGGRNYLTTPRNCPAGGWRTGITFHYGDGTVESVTSTSKCTAPPPTPGRCRHAVVRRLAAAPSHRDDDPRRGRCGRRADDRD